MNAQKIKGVRFGKSKIWMIPCPMRKDMGRDNYHVTQKVCGKCHAHNRGIEDDFSKCMYWINKDKQGIKFYG